VSADGEGEDPVPACGAQAIARESIFSRCFEKSWDEPDQTSGEALENAHDGGRSQAKLKDMKSFLTHLLAAALGMVAIILWPEPSGVNDTVPTDADLAEGNDRGIRSPDSVALPKARPVDSPPALQAELSQPIARADLESWLESKKNDSHSFAEALVMAGLITKDPALIRRGIEVDPENPHLLFIGATLPEFSKEERLELSKRLLVADPDNGLAAFVSASHLLDAGHTDTAIQILRETTQRHRMDGFGIDTQLGMEDAYIAAGLSPDSAKFRSTFDFRLGYLSDLRSLANSLKHMEGSRSPDEASELRSLTALMGQRLADQSRSGTLIDHLVGIALEEATMRGLSDEAPSPYEGLTVRQARESIVAEGQEIRQVTTILPDIQELLWKDPDLMSRYIDRFRLRGELNAAKWLVGETENSK
jgi:hypothetical protein